MAETSHNPEDRSPWPELGEILRPAVEQVRRMSPPPEAMTRALSRARQFGQVRPRVWITRRAQLLISGAVAATLLIGLGVRYGSYPLDGFQAGLRDNKKVHTASAGAPASPSGSESVPPPPDRPHVLLVRNTRLLGTGEYGHDVLPIALLHQASNWADWERIQGLRELVRGMPAVDQKGVENYLRHLTTGVGLQHSVWRRDTLPLPQARVQDSAGRELRLQGVSIHVRIEGPRARTMVDHIFHNPYAEPLTGTIECPLPEGSSPSFFSLFPGQGGRSPSAGYPGSRRELPQPPDLVPTPATLMREISSDCWGEPRQAIVVPVRSRGEAIQATQARVAGNDRLVHPATAFRGPVGTVQPHSKIRVLVAYEELLPMSGGRLVYRHLLPAGRLYDLKFVLQVDRAQAREAVFEPEDATQEECGSVVTYRRTWKNVTNAGQVVFWATPPVASVQATSGTDEEGRRYLYARLRPTVVAPAPPAARPGRATYTSPAFARHAVFLLDTSAAEDPRRFDLCVRLMGAVLKADPNIDRFNVLTFSTTCAWLEPKGWLANTQAGRETALARLDGAVLEGASDLSAAMTRLRTASFIPRGTPVDAFLLSDGRLTWGQTDLARLVGRFETTSRHPVRWHCYSTGLGEENAELFAALTRRGGGVYRCSSLSDVPAVALAHRHPCLVVKRLRFVGGPEARDVLVAGRRAAVHPGGELLVAARFAKELAPDGSNARPAQMRTKVVLEGELGGKPVVEEFPIELSDDGQLAARAWGELAVASLLALNDPALEPLATAYAGAFGIASRATAFTLTDEKPGGPAEAENAYARIVKGELGGFLESAWAGLARPMTSRDLRQRLSARVESWSPSDSVRQELRGLVALIDETWPVPPEAGLSAGLLSRALAWADYLAARARHRNQVGPYLDEASRRAQLGDAGGAIRVLTSLVELHPDQAEVVRLVACRLLAMRQATLAVQLLARLVEAQPADPASHRALAMALDDAGRPSLAALHYEAALAQLGGRGGWYQSVRAEYTSLLARTARTGKVTAPVRKYMVSRLDELGKPTPAAAGLVVTVTWNSVASHIDLAVNDARGRPVVVAAPADQPGTRQGPRRAELRANARGEYEVLLRLAQASPETMPETCARVEVVRHAGTPNEQAERFTVLLRRQGEQQRVCRVNLEK